MPGPDCLPVSPCSCQTTPAGTETVRKRDPARVRRQMLRLPLVQTEIADGRPGARHQGRPEAGRQRRSRDHRRRPGVQPAAASALTYNQTELRMPPTGKLPDEKIAAFEKWIAAGAPDPREETPETANAPPPPAKHGMDIETGRKWWAFQPVAPQPQPKFKDAAFAKRWTREKIDGSSSPDWSKTSFNPSPEADRATLIAARLARSHRTAPYLRGGSGIRRRQRSQGVREADRPPAGLAALRRALGTLLARCGPLRRRQSHVGSDQSALSRSPGGIAIG